MCLTILFSQWLVLVRVDRDVDLWLAEKPNFERKLEHMDSPRRRILDQLSRAILE